VPALGFYLSAQSLPPIKSWWLARRYRGQRQAGVPAAAACANLPLVENDKESGSP